MDPAGTAAHAGTPHRPRRKGGLLRWGTALWLLLYLVSAPLHLYLEPHCDVAASAPDSSCRAGEPCPAAFTSTPDAGHHRHPALDHDLKAVRPERTLQALAMPLPAGEAQTIASPPPRPRLTGLSGLSPPELPGSWRFLLRAAGPPRAPSLAS